jgi:hypothetical protein
MSKITPVFDLKYFITIYFRGQRYNFLMINVK